MDRVFGYCRISTNKQDIERQVRNILAAFPNAQIHKEVFTGTKKTGRKKLEYIVKEAQKGDTIVFDSVSRMSRNADEGIALYMQLYDKGVKLVFLKEPHINTDSYIQALNRRISEVGNNVADIYINATNEVLKIIAEQQIRLAFEQSAKEVEDLHRRTSEGIETARRKGKQIGQREGAKLKVKKAAKAKQIILQHARAFGGTLSDVECIKLCGVARNTYYKYKKEIWDDAYDGQ